ncbi:ABC transporter permease [Peteryoungia desertarenae]|uniref:ABC transporter permease n=1 Tax=Peteryoungia desertarenae TaxID=1813451 RepID=A0ABX6QJN7_9HYPH|nr:ABC transporter permease [Peteryoungia desertarenae]QLF68694.1 ABC transporter permease [Peteryoungia desertarenae]
MNGSLQKIKVAFRIALRELRGGLKGFYIFLACIALGTAAIAAVNSVSMAITEAISSEGRTLLAGDIRFELDNREADADELRFLESMGTVSVSTGLRSMARLPDGSDQSLVEVKAVDQEYPLYGTFVADPDLPLSDLLAERDGVWGAVAAPLLLERMGMQVGDEILLGNARFRITASIVTEPDSISDGFGFAPRFLTSRAGLQSSGLIATGSLVEHAYKIRLDDQAMTTEQIRKQAQDQFPSAGWSIRGSDRAAPALTENIERFSQFLTLVGLTALVVGGVGVANAVRAFLDSKRTVIATLKCVGAPAAVVVMVYLIQITLVAAIGIGFGLILGAIAPIAAASYLSGILPISAEPTLYPRALLLAAMFGVLVTLAFAILPLGHARKVPATALFREQGFDTTGLPSWPYVLATGIALALLAALAIFTSEQQRIATIFLAAMAGGFILLRAVAYVIAMAARRSPVVHSAALRLAIGNIHRPGALTPAVTLSLGLGLTLLVALALIDGNLRRELTGNLPERAPNFFFVDIQGSEIDAFRTLVEGQAPEGKLIEVPMLRGRILELNGVDVAKVDVPPEGRWVLRGDRGLTYAQNVPENSAVTEGSWWAPDYTGEPLVSFSAQEASELGLKIGDTITVNVLGRNITARIANFRSVEWESLSMNFVMVFSPNTFAGAPHAWLATLIDGDATAAEEAAILRSVTQTFPTITTVRVKDALEVVDRVVGQLATAIRAAAAIALIASVLVLSGALAAGNRARTHDAVVLKTLGATRSMLIRAFTYEYLLLGAATAVFALIAGGGIAWFVLSQIMNLPSNFLPDVAAMTLALALVVTIGVGLAGTWRILGQKAAPILREL